MISYDPLWKKCIDLKLSKTRMPRKKDFKEYSRQVGKERIRCIRDDRAYLHETGVPG